ncbi:hypothetical protein [Chryseobacterium wangxinyae]|uniref:hypothetical protein n=1 Tax=Chryseobacterium sp. CY353 TaxID=2997334 RepID=UPI00226E688D|nr:hypothetical protein [Chryseobacterium sp. CY353]MCY0970007.1 hypothetical protein [Chryseobacterium sp. CY353]
MGSKFKIILILLLQTLFYSAQISNKIKKVVEPIDYQYFKIILTENYDEEGYSNLYKMFSKVSDIATNDELFYLALNGSTFIRINSVSVLVARKDHRIIKLYRYYSEFPLEYETKIGHVISKQDMALSNIRAQIFSQIINYNNYQNTKKLIKNQSLSDFYSKDEMVYYENLDITPFENLIVEFDKIDKLFIPQRIESYEEIQKNWIDEKLQIPTISRI